ncbi:MAG: hypothetical protein BGO98_48640 [Myxococcales bacterium 68-20]|nr:MAG: hypothetical protein BGO98_48640 [Myxococcales bacterium 68-20]
MDGSSGRAEDARNAERGLGHPRDPFAERREVHRLLSEIDWARNDVGAGREALASSIEFARGSRRGDRAEDEQLALGPLSRDEEPALIDDGDGCDVASIANRFEQEAKGLVLAFTPPSATFHHHDILRFTPLETE